MAWAGNFLLCSIHISCGTHPVHFAVAARGYLPVGSSSQGMKWAAYSHLIPKLRLWGLYLHSPMISLYDTRNKFIFAPPHTSLVEETDLSPSLHLFQGSVSTLGSEPCSPAVCKDKFWSLKLSHNWYFLQHILHPGVWSGYLSRRLNEWMGMKSVMCTNQYKLLLYWTEKHSSAYESSLNYYYVHTKGN